MADNTTLNAGTGGDTIATDDIGSVKHQRVKLSLGPDGTANDAIAGAGAVGVGVQRVTLASDDPAVASVQIMDDWDEADRAKVNPIVGQAGVAAGAGAVGVTTQRTTLASDDPAVVSLQIVDDWDESDRAKVNLIVGQAGISAGVGTVAANTPRVTHASDDPLVTAIQLIDDSIKTDDAAFTPATDKVTMVGFEFDDSSPDSVNEGDAGAARMSANRSQYVQIRDGAGNERGLTIDASGLIGLPAGAATGAKQDTGNTALAAIQVAAEIIDNVVKAVDGVAGGTDNGVPSLVVRDDALTTLTPADGDYTNLRVDSTGRLHCNIEGATVDINAGSLDSISDINTISVSITPGTGTLHLGKAEDGVHVTGAVGVMALAVRKDTQASTAGTDNDYAALIQDANGALYVNLTNSLPAGTNGIGKLTANAGVNIGTVDVNSFAPGTAATSLGKAEDAAHSSGDVGVFMLVKRTDTVAQSAGTDGDYSALINDSLGRLWTHVGAIEAGDNNIGNVDIASLPGAVETDIAAIKTAAQLIDDAIFAEDVASNAGEKGMAVLVIRKDSAAALAGTDGDYTHLQVDSSGSLRVTGGGGGTQYVEDAALGATPTGTLSMLRRDDALGTLTPVEDDAISARCNSRGAMWVIHDGAVTLGAGSASIGILGSNPGVNIGSVAVLNGTGAAAVNIQDGGNTITVDGTISVGVALPAGNNNIGDVDVMGTTAHDASASSTAPVLIGGRANANEPTAVADGDATHAWMDTLGRLIVLAGHPSPETPISVNPTASGNTTVIAAPGASLSLYICKASVHNRDSSNRVVSLTDGAGGTTRWRAELASEGGGSLIDFGSRGWKLTANTPLNVNLDAAGNVDVNVTDYYIAP